MKKITALCLSAFVLVASSYSATYYVCAKNGNNQNEGSLQKPFKTIQKGADIAKSGDSVIVREGTYREHIDPKNGGTSNEDRITYKVYEGEKVYIKGSEIVKAWQKQDDGTWKAVIDNKIFKGHNPFATEVEGDWFNSLGRKHHTGDVYINGNSLYEMASLKDVLDFESHISSQNKNSSKFKFFAEVDDKNTTIYASFDDLDPNENLVEVSARRTCFYPTKEGINYLTISGFDISQAATQWAAPTAEQVGMVSTNWNKGWVIKNNLIHDTKANGITLGKEKETGHNVWSANRAKDGSVHYIEVTMNTIHKGWSKANIGSHIVANNEIYHCEQTAMCGSQGASFSLIENNYIHDNWVKRQFVGAEIAGIKFHAPIDAVIRNNLIINSRRGIWLDWMVQGVRVYDNVSFKNVQEDIYLEVNHGPFIIENNILGSEVSLFIQSGGGVYINNLLAGTLKDHIDSRYTPYFYPRDTKLMGVSRVFHGDSRFFNNLFITRKYPIKDIKNSTGAWGRHQYGLQVYDMYENKNLAIIAKDNAYFSGYKGYKNEKQFYASDFKPDFEIIEKADGIYLSFEMPEDIKDFKSKIYNSKDFGKTKIAECEFTDANDNYITFDKDFFGKERSQNSPVGPFASLKTGKNVIKVWSFNK